MFFFWFFAACTCVSVCVYFSALSPLHHTSFECWPPMTSETVSSAKRQRLWRLCRMVRDWDQWLSVCVCVAVHACVVAAGGWLFKHVQEAYSSVCTILLFSVSFSIPVPDEPPTILAIKPTTTTSVLVKWKVPKHNRNPRDSHSQLRATAQNFECRLITLRRGGDPCHLTLRSVCMSVCLCESNYRYLLNQTRSEGNTAIMEDGEQEGKTNGGTYSRGRGREMIKH